jgi:hypothetical protein
MTLRGFLRRLSSSWRRKNGLKTRLGSYKRKKNMRPLISIDRTKLWHRSKIRLLKGGKKLRIKRIFRMRGLSIWTQKSVISSSRLWSRRSY